MSKGKWKSKRNKERDLEEAFIDHVMGAQGIIHKVCRIYCDNPEDRKDLFQEIMINLWKSYPSFRGESAFTTWMYRISLNIAIQHLRKSGKRKEDAALPEELDRFQQPKKESLPEHELALLKNAVNKLNKVEKAIVVLYLEEKGNEEIADIIGISQNYVRVKMTRIRNKLKKMVQA